MVKLTQIEDEANTSVNSQVPKTAVEENDEDYEDTSESESEESDDEDEDELDLANETLVDRIVALKEIIPPNQRSFLSQAGSSLSSLATGGAFKIGSLLWIVSTSALLLGVPLSLSILSEQQLVEMEKEMKMQQDSAQVLAPGSDNAFDAQNPAGQPAATA